jgi:hypothetical protein
MAATQSRSQVDGASDVAMQPEPPTFLTASEDHWRPKRKSLMSVGTIILIILIIALLGGLFRSWRGTVLWHRILWRQRAWTYHSHPADPDFAGKDLIAAFHLRCGLCRLQRLGDVFYAPI